MNTIETLDPNVFKHLIVTIGALPTSFIDSMSYYEMIAWLVNYIKTEVVPAVNNNAEAVKEIQDWIETLDLSSYVGEKIDEMAESGELATIIAQIVDLGTVFGYDNIAAMAAAENLGVGSICRVLGNTTATTGDGAFYRVRELLNSDVIDGVNKVTLTNTDNLIAVRIPDAAADALDDRVDTLETTATSLGGRVTALEAKKHMVVIGDSFSTTTYNPAETAWYTIVAKRLNLTVHNYAKDSAGYVHAGSGGRTFSIEVDDADADTSFNNNDVEYVFVYGGLNDMNTTDCDTIDDKAALLFDKIALKFPNARIVCAGINTWSGGCWVNGNNTTMNYWYHIKKACRNKGVIFINCIPWLLSNDNQNYNMDNNHPNELGNKMFATNLLSAMFGQAGVFDDVSMLSSTATTGSGSLSLTITQGTIKIQGSVTCVGGTAVVPIPKHIFGSFQVANTIIGVSGSKTVCWINRDVNNFTVHGDGTTTYYFGWCEPYC